ncbi:MAG: hypothetical protein OIF56_08570 [Cohaesibacter sp.]|nr:hypothetical protein [Cohaesibacter sp.]MCV6602849.1 hypothetical protein [Cohaesibacter sp.]
MRWIAHILTVFAVIGCLVGAGQAQSGYGTHSDCPSSQSSALEAQEGEALQRLEQASLQGSSQISGQESESALAETQYCAYYWADLPLPAGFASLAKRSVKMDHSRNRINSLAIAGLDRPPKFLFL